MQVVFRVNSPPPPPERVLGLSEPSAEVDVRTLENFWARVSELTSRYHDVDQKWINGTEIREWNRKNRIACQKCTDSKTKRECVIDEDSPNCRPCRAIKIGCDRKPKFLFDLTKAEFFADWDQFFKVWKEKQGRVVRGKRTKSDKPRPKKSSNSRESSQNQMEEDVARLEARVQENTKRVSELEALIIEMSRLFSDVADHAPNLQAAALKLHDMSRRNEMLVYALTPPRMAIVSAVQSIERLSTLINSTNAEDSP
ncbi:hypothetical protein DFH06DRAFT_1230432 [Mycena polygramma]|nr:hypothetical protein DFH06DRAFT_1230432 [Mycena polygramma]